MGGPPQGYFPHFSFEALEKEFHKQMGFYKGEEAPVVQVKAPNLERQPTAPAVSLTAAPIKAASCTDANEFHQWLKWARPQWALLRKQGFGLETRNRLQQWRPHAPIAVEVPAHTLETVLETVPVNSYPKQRISASALIEDTNISGWNATPPPKLTDIAHRLDDEATELLLHSWDVLISFAPVFDRSPGFIAFTLLEWRDALCSSSMGALWNSVMAGITRALLPRGPSYRIIQAGNRTSAVHRRIDPITSLTWSRHLRGYLAENLLDRDDVDEGLLHFTKLILSGESLEKGLGSAPLKSKLFMLDQLLHDVMATRPFKRLMQTHVDEMARLTSRKRRAHSRKMSLELTANNAVFTVAATLSEMVNRTVQDRVPAMFYTTLLSKRFKAIEARRTARQEEELEQQNNLDLIRVTTRGFCLGQDRFKRSFYIFGQCLTAIFVYGPSSAPIWGYYSMPDTLDPLFDYLNPCGERESKLISSLKRFSDLFRAARPLPTPALTRSFGEEVEFLRAYQTTTNTWKRCTACYCSFPSSEQHECRGPSSLSSSFNVLKHLIIEVQQTVLSFHNKVPSAGPVLDAKSLSELRAALQGTLALVPENRLRSFAEKGWRAALDEAVEKQSIPLFSTAFYSFDRAIRYLAGSPDDADSESSASEHSSEDEMLCVVCERDVSSRKLVSCDTCDRYYHVYCLDPELPAVPRGEWTCPRCSSSKPRGSTRGSQRRKRTRRK